MSLKARNEPSGEEYSECLPPSPPIGAPVQTACGETILYTANTPCIFLDGRAIYFCLSVCKVYFDQDPKNSCLSIGPRKSSP